MRKSEEIEGCRLAATPLSLGLCKRAKLDGLRLFRRYLKAKYGQSLIKRLAEPYCVTLTLETYNKVISVWRHARFEPAFYIFVITLIALLVLIVLFEWLKPSFRSERHIAHYLKVPILGAFPDLKRITGDGGLRAQDR